jgi:hypothetical protein
MLRYSCEQTMTVNSTSMLELDWFNSWLQTLRYRSVQAKIYVLGITRRRMWVTAGGHFCYKDIKRSPAWATTVTEKIGKNDTTYKKTHQCTNISNNIRSTIYSRKHSVSECSASALASQNTAGSYSFLDAADRVRNRKNFTGYQFLQYVIHNCFPFGIVK